MNVEFLIMYKILIGLISDNSIEERIFQFSVLLRYFMQESIYKL